MADLKDAFNRGTNNYTTLLTIKKSSIEYHNLHIFSSDFLGGVGVLAEEGGFFKIVKARLGLGFYFILKITM